MNQVCPALMYASTQVKSTVNSDPGTGTFNSHSVYRYPTSGLSVHLSFSTQTHGILSSPQQLLLPWLCVAIGYSINVRFDASEINCKFRSRYRYVSHSVYRYPTRYILHTIRGDTLYGGYFTTVTPAAVGRLYTGCIDAVFNNEEA